MALRIHGDRAVRAFVGAFGQMAAVRKVAHRHVVGHVVGGAAVGVGGHVDVAGRGRAGEVRRIGRGERRGRGGRGGVAVGIRHREGEGVAGARAGGRSAVVAEVAVRAVQGQDVPVGEGERVVTVRSLHAGHGLAAELHGHALLAVRAEGHGHRAGHGRAVAARRRGVHDDGRHVVHDVDVDVEGAGVARAVLHGNGVGAGGCRIGAFAGVLVGLCLGEIESAVLDREHAVFRGGEVGGIDGHAGGERQRDFDGDVEIGIAAGDNGVIGRQDRGDRRGGRIRRGRGRGGCVAVRPAEGADGVFGRGRPVQAEIQPAEAVNAFDERGIGVVVEPAAGCRGRGGGAFRRQQVRLVHGREEFRPGDGLPFDDEVRHVCLGIGRIEPGQGQLRTVIKGEDEVVAFAGKSYGIGRKIKDNTGILLARDNLRGSGCRMLERHVSHGMLQRGKGRQASGGPEPHLPRTRHRMIAGGFAP